MDGTALVVGLDAAVAAVALVVGTLRLVRALEGHRRRDLAAAAAHLVFGVLLGGAVLLAGTSVGAARALAAAAVLQVVGALALAVEVRRTAPAAAALGLLAGGTVLALALGRSPGPVLPLALLVTGGAVLHVVLAGLSAARRRAEEVAHEARSSFAAIEGATTNLARCDEDLPDDYRALASAVSGEVRRLRRLVDPVTPTVQTFGLGALLKPLVAAERARGTTVRYLIPGGLTAHGAPEAVADAVRTLLDNARRHAPGPVTVRAGLERGDVVVRVEDRGPGVPARRRAVIFARGRRSGPGAGRGLGLWLAAEALRRSGGRVWVEDRPGGGSSFAVALPVVAVPVAPEAAALWDAVA